MPHSLRQHSLTQRTQVVMVTSEVSWMKRQGLKSVASEVIEVSSRPSAQGHSSKCGPTYENVPVLAVVYSGMYELGWPTQFF